MLIVLRQCCWCCCILCVLFVFFCCFFCFCFFGLSTICRLRISASTLNAKGFHFQVISAIIQQCDGSVKIISVVHHAFLISMLETSYPKSNYSRNVYLFCLFLVCLLVCFALAVCFCLFFVFVFVYLPLFSFFL